MITPADSFSVDLPKLADALQITETDCVKEFTDGRVIARFTELWACRKFGFIRHSRDHAGSDGFCPMPDGDTVEIAIRTLTDRGIKFQASKHIGSGRKCSNDDLSKSIRNTDRWFVFDIRRFPEIDVLKLKTSLLESWIAAGELNPNGLSANKFIRLLNRDAQPQYRQLHEQLRLVS